MIKKNLVKLCFIVFLMPIFNATGGGIPVFDGAANTASLTQWAEKLKQWVETANHYKEQVKAYQNQANITTDQLNQIKGIKDNIKNFNIKTLLKDIGAIDNLIPDYNSIVENKWNPQAEQLANKLKIDQKCQVKENSNIKYNEKMINICKSENLNLATNYLISENINEQVNSISKKVANLAIEVSKSDSIKETADINNKIALYNGQLETLDRKLTLVQKKYQLNEDLIAKQKEALINEINARSSNDYFTRLGNAFDKKNKAKNKNTRNTYVKDGFK